jgi:HK97 family phage major capsid protein
LFRELATVFVTTGGGKIKVASPGGDAAFVGENGAFPKDTAEIMSYTVNTHKIGKIAVVSNVMLTDSGFSLEKSLARDFGRAFGRCEEDGIINGNGEYQPYGLLHSEYGAEVGLTCTEVITYDDVKALFFALDSQYRRSASWVMSDSTALHLRGLKDTNGLPLWNHNADTLFGKNVYTSPFMPDIGTGNIPILFGDFSYYWFMQRGDLTLETKYELYAESGAAAFYGTEFVDGRLIRREAVKALQMS